MDHANDTRGSRRPPGPGGARLSRAVADRWPIQPSACALLYSSVHDTYAITSTDGRYVLKVYRAGVRTAREVAWECDLVRHLTQRGAPVSPVVAARSGAVVQSLTVDGVERHAVLFLRAPGDKPMRPRTTDLYRRVGRAAGLIHNAADSFPAGTAPRSLGVVQMIDEPLEAMRPQLLAAGGDYWAYAADVGGRLADHLRRLTGTDLDWGVCHNDLTLDNLHVDASGEVTVFDFDSAGLGYRANEPAGVYQFDATERNGFWSAYRSGYGEVRTLTEADVAAVPHLVLAAGFENLAWRLGATATSVELSRDGTRWDHRAELEATVGTDGWWRRWELEQLGW